jgi:hypothetical protein
MFAKQSPLPFTFKVSVHTWNPDKTGFATCFMPTPQIVFTAAYNYKQDFGRSKRPCFADGRRNTRVWRNVRLTIARYSGRKHIVHQL